MKTNKDICKSWTNFVTCFMCYIDWFYLISTKVKQIKKKYWINLQPNLSNWFRFMGLWFLYKAKTLHHSVSSLLLYKFKNERANEISKQLHSTFLSRVMDTLLYNVKRKTDEKNLKRQFDGVSATLITMTAMTHKYIRATKR